MPSRRLLSANGGVMRQEGWRGNSLACGGSIGPGEQSLELPGHEAPEGFQRTPLEDANHLIARPCRVCFTVPGLPADHPDVLRPAELGGLPDPRHGVGGAGLVRQNNNDTASAQSERHDVIPCHDGNLAIRSSHCPCNKPLLHQSVKKGKPPAPGRQPLLKAVPLARGALMSRDQPARPAGAISAPHRGYRPKSCPAKTGHSAASCPASGANGKTP